MREEIGLRVHQAEFFEDFFPAAHPDEPVMNDRDTHHSNPSISAHRSVTET